jgi:ABC-type branched-subunit amino acid transport system substrate-binding protein
LRTRQLLVVVTTLALVAAGCGARLSKTQLQALRAGSSRAAGSGDTSAAAGGGTGDTGASPVAAGGGPTVGGQGGTSGGGTGGGATGGGGAARTGGGATGGGGGAGGGPGGAGLTSAGGPVCPAGAPSSDPGVTASTITLGNVSTQTGPVPGLFAGAHQGIQAFAKYANAHGGVCGRQLQVTSVDDNLDGGQNSTQVQQLIPKVLEFAGSFSVVDEGGAPAMGSSGVPDIGIPISPARFNLPVNFSPQPNPIGGMTGPLNYYKQKYGTNVITHAAEFDQNAPSVLAQAQGFQAAAKSVGFNFVVERHGIDPTQSSWSAEVAAMQQKGVQAVFFVGAPNAIGQMAADMAAAGFNPPLQAWFPQIYDPVFLQQAGPAANNAHFWLPTAMFAGEDAATNPEVVLFDQWMKTVAPGTVPSLYAVYGWMAGRLLVQGLNAGGAPTRAALLKGIRSITNWNGNGLIGPSNPGTKTPPTCYILVNVQGGKFVRDPASASGFRCNDGPYFKL